MRFQCYASGSGALSFVWLEKQNVGGRTHRTKLEQEIASGRAVTEADVMEFFRSPEGRHLQERGFLPMQIDGLWQLVCVLTRVGPNKLRLPRDGNKIISYELEKADGEIRDYAVKMNVEIQDEAFDLYNTGHDTQIMEVKNVSIRSQVVYFLNHERQIAEALSAPESVAK